MMNDTDRTMPMNILFKIHSLNAYKYGKLLIFICAAAFFFSIFTLTFTEANQSSSHNGKSSVASILTLLNKTKVDVFIGEYGRETLNYMVSGSKTEPLGMRLSPKTVSINSLFLNSRSIRKKNPNITTSNYIFSPDSANHLRA